MKANYITPAVTVFSEDGSIHFEEQGKVYEHLIAGGVDGILILGSIGEFFALSMEQKKESDPFCGKDNRSQSPSDCGDDQYDF